MDVVVEFLHAVVAEQVKLAVPLLLAFDPEDTIAERVCDQVLKLIPNPCEEAAKHVDAAESAPAVTEDPATALPELARDLVPGTVGRILGLINDEGEAAA